MSEAPSSTMSAGTSSLTADSTRYVVMDDVVFGPEVQRGCVAIRYPQVYVREGTYQQRRARALEVAAALNAGTPIPDGLRIETAAPYAEQRP